MDEASYHAAREAIERRLAEKASDPRVRQAHLDLARLHGAHLTPDESATLRDLLDNVLRKGFE